MDYPMPSIKRVLGMLIESGRRKAADAVVLRATEDQILCFSRVGDQEIEELRAPLGIMDRLVDLVREMSLMEPVTGPVEKGTLVVPKAMIDIRARDEEETFVRMPLSLLDQGPMREIVIEVGLAEED